MKTIKMIMIAAGIVLVAACDKGEKVQAYTWDAGGEYGTLTFNVNSELTKAASGIEENGSMEKFLDKNFQIIAYENDGAGNYGALTSWYNLASVNGQSSFTTTIRTGKKKMLYVCNQSLLNPSVATTWGNRGEIFTSIKDAITENHLPLGLGFCGENTDLDVTAGSNTPVNVELIRMCSRVALKSVTNDMSFDSRVEDISAVSLTLLNVPNGLNMDGTVKNEPYYNELGGDYSTQAKCSSGNGAGAFFFRSLAYSGANLNTAYLYTFPGDNLYMMAGIDIKLKNELKKTYYYAIPLKNLKFNKSYDVRLSVRTLGSEDPANPAITNPTTFSVTVAPWTAAESIEEMM